MKIAFTILIRKIFKMAAALMLITFAIYSLLHFSYSVSKKNRAIKENNAEIVLNVPGSANQTLKVIRTLERVTDQAYFSLDPLTALKLNNNENKIDENDKRIKRVTLKDGPVDTITYAEQDVKIKIVLGIEEIISSEVVLFYDKSREEKGMPGKSGRYYRFKNKALQRELGTTETSYPSEYIAITEFTGPVRLDGAKREDLIKQRDETDKKSLFGYFDWLLSFPSLLFKFLNPYAFNTLLITVVTLILILVLVFIISLSVFISEMRWREKGYQKKSAWILSVVSVFFMLPAFCIAYIFSSLIHGVDSTLFRMTIAALILCLFDGIISGLYQQVSKMIKNEMDKDYITGVRAKGIRYHTGFFDSFSRLIRGEPSIMLHVFRNILPELLPLINNQVPYILNGAIVLEAILGIDGISVFILYGFGKAETIGKILTLVVFCLVMTRITNYYFKRRLKQ